MTPAQLRTFLAVAETGSVRAAAQRLVVTESAVSASLAALQKALGVRLTRKDGRGLRLTEAGEVYVGYARTVLGLLDEGRAAARGEVAPGRGRLRIAAFTTAGEQILPALLASFRRRYPDVDMMVEVGNRERVWSLLDHREVDLVISGRPARPGRTIHGVRSNELIVVAPPDLAVQTGERPVLHWLGEQTWLLRERGSGTRATTEAFLADLGLTPRTLTVGSNVAVRESVVAGLGVTLMSRDAVARELDRGLLAEIAVPGTPLRRDWYLVSGEVRLPATAALLTRHVLDIGEFDPPPAAPRRGEDYRSAPS